MQLSIRNCISTVKSRMCLQACRKLQQPYIARLPGRKQHTYALHMYPTQLFCHVGHPQWNNRPRLYRDTMRHILSQDKFQASNLSKVTPHTGNTLVPSPQFYKPILLLLLLFVKLFLHRFASVPAR